VVPLEKVRTGSRAKARVLERAAEAVGESTVDIAVQHAAASERADALASERAGALADASSARVAVRKGYIGEVGAVLAAHSGPGLVCAVLHRVLTD